MTSVARPSQEPVFTSRTPYVPFVVLIGAVLLIALTLRFLNAEEAPAYPMSGAPVGAAGEGVVAAPPTVNRAASGSLSMLLPMDEAGQALQVGPAAFPPGSAVVLSATLPTAEETFISVSLARLTHEGALEHGQPISIRVDPDAEGRVRVSTSVEELTGELGRGIYRVRLGWNNQAIGGTDVALGVLQPANVAIFDAPRAVTFAAGEYTGVRLNERGRVVEEKPFALGSASGAPSIAYARFFNTPHVLIVEGVWAGYWVPLSEGTTLVDSPH